MSEANNIKQLDDEQDLVVLKFISNIKYGKLQGSNKIAVTALTLLEKLINDTENATAAELCRMLHAVGRRISDALPDELVALNMVRRVLRLVRDEERAHDNEGEVCESLQRLVLATERNSGSGSGGQGSGSAGGVCEALREPLAELFVELEASVSNVKTHGAEQIQPGEYVLTYEASALVEGTLRAAAKRARGRPPKLLLAGGPEPRKSHEMAVRLSEAGIHVTVIDLASCFAVMSKVNKVLLGVRAVFAGGAVLAAAGMHMVTLAANYYKVPVIGLAPLYKLSPVYIGQELEFAALRSPEIALPYENPASCTTHVYAPLFEQVPANQVTVFITNHGACAPTYIYRSLQELYDPKDYDL